MEEKEVVILVVDDHLEMQHYVKSILAAYSRGLIASYGVEALDLLEKNKIDLITVDLMMPNMNGSEFLAKLKALDMYKFIPTVMLTAMETEEDRVKGFAIGINDYITKPFSQ